MLYNEVLGGWEDKVVILEAKEDNLLLNNAEVLQGIILDNPHQNINEKEPVATHLVPNNH